MREMFLAARLLCWQGLEPVLRSLLANVLLAENESRTQDLEREHNCDIASREEITHYWETLSGLVLGLHRAAIVLYLQIN